MNNKGNFKETVHVVLVALNKSPDLVLRFLFECPFASPLGNRFGAGLVTVSSVMGGGARILASFLTFLTDLITAVILTLCAVRCISKWIVCKPMKVLLLIRGFILTPSFITADILS